MEPNSGGAMFSLEVLVKLHESKWLTELDYRNQVGKFGLLVVWDEVELGG